MYKIKSDNLHNIYKGISCVYRLQFIDGSFYIGSTTCLKRRMSLHLCMLRNNSQTTFYGKLKTRELSYVAIVERVENKRELRQTENALIKKYKYNKRLLNIPIGSIPHGNEMIKLFNGSKARPSTVNVVGYNKHLGCEKMLLTP